MTKEHNRSLTMKINKNVVQLICILMLNLLVNGTKKIENNNVTLGFFTLPISIFVCKYVGNFLTYENYSMESMKIKIKINLSFSTISRCLLIMVKYLKNIFLNTYREFICKRNGKFFFRYIFIRPFKLV